MWRVGIARSEVIFNINPSVGEGVSLGGFAGASGDLRKKTCRFSKTGWQEGLKTALSSKKVGPGFINKGWQKMLNKTLSKKRAFSGQG